MRVYIWIQFLLISLSIRLLGRSRLGGRCSFPLLLSLVLLALLLALLQFRLGDMFTRNFVEVEVC